MNKLRPGQRWISEMEPELGLGSLVDISGKRVRIRFEGSDCTRQYLLGAAPLRRVRYVEGDTIISRKNRRFRVTRVEEDEGLLVYHGEGISLDETELAHHMGFTAPRDRAGRCFGIPGPPSPDSPAAGVFYIPWIRAGNPAVKERDIRMIESEAREIDTRLGQARLRLDALRLIRII